MKKIKIFLGAYLNFTNAQNINCKSISKFLDKEKFTVSSMLLSSNSSDYEDIITYNCVKPYRITTLFAMFKGILNCDIAYFPKHTATPRWIILLCKWLSIPVFTTIEMNVRDKSKINLIDNFGGVKPFKNYFNLVPHIYGISQFIINHNKNIIKINNKVLPLGVDNKLFEFNLKKNLKNIVFIGNLVLRKNIDEFLKLALVFPDLNFHIIGDGELKSKLQKKSSKNVNFYGQLNHYEISLLLEKMDVLFLPSKSEGFPKVILEAAACGIPSILYSDYGASEWINHNKNGFIVNNFSDVVTILHRLRSDKILLSSCSRSVFDLSSRFSWTNCIKIWENEIERIVND